MHQFQRLLYAHRGACLKFPENTIQAFRAGLEDGANALELDVHRTVDDVIVVIHDDNGQRVAGNPAKIKRSTLQEIRRWKVAVPTLKEVIETFKDVPINIDIKEPDTRTVRGTVELVTQMNAQGRVLLTAKSRHLIRLIHACGYQGPMGTSILDIVALYFLPKLLIGRRYEGRAAQVPVKRYPFNLATRWFVEKCHALGVRVDYWTINDAQTAKMLLDLGADGIMSDDPAALKSVWR